MAPPAPVRPDGTGGAVLQRLEPVLFGFFIACWLAALLQTVGLLHLAGTLLLPLQAIFLSGAAAGWLCGNIYVHRRQHLPAPVRRRLLIAYLIAPPGLPTLLWALMPLTLQRQAPLVPLYAFAVSTIFFLVPLLLRWPTPRR